MGTVNLSSSGGGDALTTDPLSQFAATTSAQLRGVISDETGTGAAVFQNGDIGTPSAAVLTNATGLPTAGLVDGAVTLAKMANLAQDLFIGRTTASTGVPETATITAAARTVLDDASVAAMATTLGLGTGSSPEFTAVNVGHATDTTLSRAGAGILQVETNRLLMNSQIQIAHPIPPVIALTTGNFQMIEDVAYWVYLGQMFRAVTIPFLRAYCTVVGTGAQTAELCLGVSSTAPDVAGGTSIAKLEATGSITAMTGSATYVTNASAFTTAYAIGDHAWAGLRTAFATNEPQMRPCSSDLGRGLLLTTATAGALTGTGPWVGAVIAAGVTHPAIIGVL